MINSLKFLVMTLLMRLSQASKVFYAVLTNQISYYPKSVKLFEKKFKEATNTAHSLMFANATSAMEAALFAGGVVENANVGTTAFVIPSSYSSVKSLGANVKYLDVDLNSLNFNLDGLAQKGSKLFALIVTHFYGNPCDMERIMAWATKNGVFVVEDCSHAHGASFKGRPIGSWGHVGVFSLQGAKAIAAGEGAVVISNDAELTLRMAAYGHQESYRKFGIDVDDDLNLPSFGFGKKMRAHPLGAILALEDLQRLAYKNEIFTSWVQEIKDIADMNGSFKLPEVLSLGKRAGFCQGIPLILESEFSALELKEMLLKVKINCFMRDYTQNIMDYSDFNSGLEVEKALPNTCMSFSQVLFIPFYQFILPWRWFRLKSVLRGWRNE